MSNFLVAREADIEKEKKSHPSEGREGVWGSTGILPLIINLSTRCNQLHAKSALPQESVPSTQ